MPLELSELPESEHPKRLPRAARIVIGLTIGVIALTAIGFGVEMWFGRTVPTLNGCSCVIPAKLLGILRV